MKKQINRFLQWNHRHRKGASTMEFVIILPLFFFLCLVIWQVIVAGIAVVDTQAALRDAVKIASTTGDVQKAEEQAKLSFGSSDQYKLEKIELKIEGEEVKGYAKVKIPIIFSDDEKIMSPITYKTTSEAPVLTAYNGQFAIGEPLLTEGGLLGPPIEQWWKYVTSGFGLRIDPQGGGVRGHKGIDIGRDIGTTIYAAADGVVTNAGPASGFGQWITIDHGNGWSTVYGHMYDYGIFVTPGQHVTRGQPIALVGNNGKSTGPHLHFELRRTSGWIPVDPAPHIARDK